MAKVDLPGLRAKTAKGRAYWYFETADRRVRVPDPSDPAFGSVYFAARRGDLPGQPSPRTFARLIDLFRVSDRWSILAPRTRRDYDRVLKWANATIGTERPDAAKRQDVLTHMAANAQRVRFANSIKEVLSVLFEFGIGIGWLTANPAKGAPRLKRRDGPPMHRVWPDETVARFCAAAGPTEKTICELAIGTGQRIGDVLRMRWDHIADGGIKVRQGKTGVTLWIPFTTRLADHLATVPRSSLTIVAGVAGRPLTYDAAAKRVRRVRARSDALAYTIHGWRYTAAASLLAGGATDDEVQAITGHKTLAMVEQYGGETRQRVRAIAGQSKRNTGAMKNGI